MERSRQALASDEPWEKGLGSSLAADEDRESGGGWGPGTGSLRLHTQTHLFPLTLGAFLRTTQSQGPVQAPPGSLKGNTELHTEPMLDS